MKKEVAVIDLGTNTVCVAFARCEKVKNKSSVTQSNNVKILGSGYQMTKGLIYGSLNSMEDLEGVLLSTIADTEKESQRHIKHVTIALPNWATESLIVDKSINIGNNPIDETHVNKLIDLSNSEYCNEEYSVIHVFPISYTVDESDGIQDPIGLLGNKLSGTFNVVTVNNKLINNLKNCLNQCGIVVDNFVSSVYASALSVTLEDEMQSGVMIIDMGGSSTTIACISNNALLYVGIIPIGGSHITMDISVVLRTNKINAERLKILYGVSYNNNSAANEEEQILVSSIDEFGEEYIQNVSRSTIDLIISSRLDELFDLIKKHIEENNIDEMYYKNIIVTGGGSQISCLNEYIKTRDLFFGSSIRLGKPICAFGSKDYVDAASFASTIGSILFAINNNNQYNKALTPANNNTFFGKIASIFKKGI